MEPNKKEALDKKWNEIVLKALSDEEFKEKLVKDPISVMIENGLDLPKGCKAGETSTK
ncbi:MAG: hypothetical protein HN474_10235, partial [Nitrospina sp.]|nr:hypothetical protein [Nitrospina sp.]